MANAGDSRRKAEALVEAGGAELDTAPLRARLGGSDTDVARIVGLFAEDAVEAVEVLEAALAAGDEGRAAAAAHALKGSAANAGARRVEALAREVEAALKTGDLLVAKAATRALAAAVGRVRDGSAAGG